MSERDRLLLSGEAQATLGAATDRVHVVIQCASLEQFDSATKSWATGVQLWADIDGQVHDRCGNRWIAALG